MNKELRREYARERKRVMDILRRLKKYQPDIDIHIKYTKEATVRDLKTLKSIKTQTSLRTAQARTTFHSAFTSSGGRIVPRLGYARKSETTEKKKAPTKKQEKIQRKKELIIEETPKQEIVIQEIPVQEVFTEESQYIEPTQTTRTKKVFEEPKQEEVDLTRDYAKEYLGVTRDKSTEKEKEELREFNRKHFRDPSVSRHVNIGPENTGFEGREKGYYQDYFNVYENATLTYLNFFEPNGKWEEKRKPGYPLMLEFYNQFASRTDNAPEEFGKLLELVVDNFQMYGRDEYYNEIDARIYISYFLPFMGEADREYYSKKLGEQDDGESFEVEKTY